MSKEEPIKVSCTWGDGPDVMVTFNDFPFILYEDVNMKGWAHGSVKKGSFDLTAEEAKKLAYALLSAAENARSLDESIKAYEFHGNVDAHFDEDKDCTCKQGTQYVQGAQDGMKCMICKGNVVWNNKKIKLEREE